MRCRFSRLMVADSNRLELELQEFWQITPWRTLASARMRKSPGFIGFSQGKAKRVQPRVGRLNRKMASDQLEMGSDPFGVELVTSGMALDPFGMALVSARMALRIFGMASDPL